MRARNALSKSEVQVKYRTIKSFIKNHFLERCRQIPELANTDANSKIQESTDANSQFQYTYPFSTLAFLGRVEMQASGCVTAAARPARPRSAASAASHTGQ
jgi:hypothetical protein